MVTQTKKVPKPLHNIFSDVTPRYDLINRIFTWGMDRKWRLKAACECLADKPERVLDLACGTGDLAITIAGVADGVLEITGVDFSESMLNEARRKAAAVNKNIKFINGDAANLPFDEGNFDCVGISFAFRNLTYKHVNAAKHIAEVLRVLRPGGRFVIVESSQPKNRFIRKLDHFYLRACVYPFGCWLSGNRNAYNYLTLSATRYYSPEELQEMLLKAGFRQVSFRRLFFGAAAIHVAVK